MVFTHSGNSGDIVFSIPTIQHLSSEAIVYIKPAKYAYGDQYTFCKDLLLQQPGIKEVRPFIPPDNNWNYFQWKGLKFDYDLDIARHQLQRGRIHIVKRYFDAFNIKNVDHKIPFLKIDELYKRKERYALIHLTSRWNGMQYNWKKIYNEAKQRHGKVYFIGLQYEWLDFTIHYGQIEHLPTENLLEMARLIRDAEALYSNQGVALTIAQGLGKEYWLVRNGNKTNCHLGTSNEHLIGSEYLSPTHTFTADMMPDSHLKRRV
jgi:hypothetical protein